MFFVCAKPFTRDGGGAIATTNDHEPPTPPILLFRTSHPPYNTHATQHATTGGQESRCSGSGPKSPVRDRPGSGTRLLGFAQLTTSRSRLARTRHHRRQSSATPELCGVIEFRCPGPTPSDVASPVCPNRHHKAGYGQLPPGSQRMPLSRLPFKRTATTISSHHDTHITSPHHCTLAYIARTDRPDGRRVRENSIMHQAATSIA